MCIHIRPKNCCFWDQSIIITWRSASCCGWWHTSSPQHACFGIKQQAGYQMRCFLCRSCQTAERQRWTGHLGHTGQIQRPRTPGKRSICLDKKKLEKKKEELHQVKKLKKTTKKCTDQPKKSWTLISAFVHRAPETLSAAERRAISTFNTT